MYVPGCPAKPEAIIDGVVKLLNGLSIGRPGPKRKRSQSMKHPRRRATGAVEQPRRPGRTPERREEAGARGSEF
jgi:NADH:ubiquinone oxidoreductase subunit B-like Fe-S oxidoreductase